MSAATVRRLTYALLNPDIAAAAAEALKDYRDRSATEALVELLHRPHSGRAGVAAVAALVGRDDLIVLDGLLAALTGPHSSVRLAAVEELHCRGAAAADEPLANLLNRDDSWPVRRGALLALADRPEPTRWRILDAATDPHWRVRHALIQVLLRWGNDPGGRGAIAVRLQADRAGEPPAYLARRAGVLYFLRFRWSGDMPAVEAGDRPPPSVLPCWDPDPAVLLRNLGRMSKSERRAALDAMPNLLCHTDTRIAAIASQTLREWGEARHFAEAIRMGDDPRTGVTARVQELLAALDAERADETRRLLGESAGLSSCLNRGEGPSGGELSLSHSHPFVRAAALTPERAATLVIHSEEETSWHVLAAAARMARVPLWKLAPPDPWQPPLTASAREEPLQIAVPSPARPRLLGPERWPVSPLGISGHYGLPAEGFVLAAEAGVNLLFWEPNYHTLTSFMQRLSPAGRRGFHLLAGTFEADGQRVRKDIDRALRSLRLERLSLFLVFWVQSWARITPDVRDALEAAKAEGKIGAFGLSTHSRPLALEAIDAGWNPVMVRHSAAHRGAEAEVFPRAAATGSSILTFSNTCYGRLLQPDGDLLGASAADCYRYAMSQQAVAGCWSAPATVEQLDENLSILRDPELPDERRLHLLARGAALYREELAFRKWVRAL